MIDADTLTYMAQTSLAVTFLICLVLAVRRPFAKAFGAKAAYALWLVPILRLVLPPLPSNWTLFGWIQAGVEPTPTVITPVATAVIQLGTAEAGSPMPPVGPPQIAFAEPAAEVSLLSAAGDAILSALPALGLIWAIGVVAVLATGIIRQIRAAGLVAVEGEDAGITVQTAALDVRQAIGLKCKDIAVKTSLISSGPLVLGLFRPTVLLPAWFEEDYSPAEQRVALMHEMMHIKRGDLWALQAAWVGVALQWFNPLAWVALAKFRVDQEAACDADVLNSGEASPYSYGATLVKAVRITRPVAQPVQAASLPLNHALHERLSQMKQPLPTARQRFNGMLLASSVGAAALLASACSTAANAQSAELKGSDDASPRALVMNTDDESNRRVIIVDDLFSEVSMDFPQLEAFEIEMQKLGEEIAAISIDMVPPESPEFPAGAFAFAMDFNDEEMQAEVARFSSEIARLASAPEVDEEAIEALAESFEARMENWADNFELRMDANSEQWEGDFETRIEAWAEEVEERAEAFEVQIEARAEEIEARAELMEERAEVFEAFGEEMEIAGETVEELAEQCEGQTGIKVVKLRRENGEENRTHKAICLEGDASETDVLQSIRDSGELSEDELARVEDALARAEAGDENVRIRIRRSEKTDNE